MGTARRLACSATISGAAVERVAGLVFLAGNSQERRRAQSLVELVNSASTDMEVSDVPATFAVPCTRIRVPIAAEAAIVDALESIENDTRTLCVWLLPLKEVPKPISEEESFFKPGVAVRARYEGEWHKAKVVDVDL